MTKDGDGQLNPAAAVAGARLGGKPPALAEVELAGAAGDAGAGEDSAQQKHCQCEACGRKSNEKARIGCYVHVQNMSVMWRRSFLVRRVSGCWLLAAWQWSKMSKIRIE